MCDFFYRRRVNTNGEALRDKKRTVVYGKRKWRPLCSGYLRYSFI
jgi:hypothetical protein